MFPNETLQGLQYYVLIGENLDGKPQLIRGFHTDKDKAQELLEWAREFNLKPLAPGDEAIVDDDVKT